MSVLAIRNLTVHLPGRVEPVLGGLSLDLAPGEILALLGESGAGKSTLALAICCLLPAGAQMTGEIRLGGLPAHASLRGRAVAPVLQVPQAGLSPVRRVGGQIADALRLAGQPGAGVSGLLQDLGLDPAVARRYPGELSGGMAQRVAIARAIATGATLIVADEPTSALDGPNASLVAATLRRAGSMGRSVLLITHDRGLADQVADRVLELRDGRIAAVSPRPAALAPPMTAPASAPPLMVLERVGRRDGRLQQISLELRRGEILALAGVSGAGKTTLARLIARLDPLGQGEIHFDGADIGGLAPARFARDPRRARIQMVFQQAGASFLPGLTVSDSILAAQRRLRRDPGAIVAAARLAGLDPDLLDRRPTQLSQGQLARAALARALAAGPDLLVLDEPTAALDAATRAGVLRTLAGLRAGGMAILLVTHDLAAASQVADRLAVMEAGRLVDFGATAELLHRPAHPATRALVAAQWMD